MTQDETVLGGRYKLDQVIGRGGMAEVWRARDIRLERDVAVKRLRVDLATDPTFQARFRREAQAAAGLNHPNIVATYDTGEEADERTGIHVPWIVMELVEGHTLRDLLRTDRRILPSKALEWTMGVLDALNYSHRAGIVHRDIKPANVMLTPSGHVKVMDFGIARAVADTSATMTQTAAVIGTAQYLSPEQARGETVDSRSDIYSAGCLLYELLTGRPPFTGESPVSVAYQHVREQPVRPSVLDPEVTPGMDAIVLKSLAKDPSRRYQTAKEMRDDIARLLAGQPVSAPLPTDDEATQLAPAAAVAPAVSPTAQTAAIGQDAAPVGATSTQAAVAEEPRRRRSPLGWIIAALLAALVAVIAVVAWKWYQPATDQGVNVPGVVGQTETAATSTLKGSGFTVSSKHVNGDAKTEGQVTEQSPTAGSKASQGSEVDITVNDGPVTNKVPSGLEGMTEKQARAALVKAGFSNANVSTQDASTDQESQHLTYTKGQVVASNPAGGASVVPATQKVVLYLATGKSTVPNVRGKSEADARTALNSAGFNTIKTTTKTVSDTSQVGVVQDQDPTDGTSLTRTKTVTLTIGAAPTTVQVPDLSGDTPSDATAALEKLGLKVAQTTSATTDQSKDGVVVVQQPSAGTTVDPGSTVTISVGQYQAPTDTATATATSSPAATDTTSTPATTPSDTQSSSTPAATASAS